ncbi:MAG: extra-cytoplasmic solute receptor protein, partial [Pseudomonadota bacterium]
MITLTIQSKCLVFLKAGLIALLLSASWGQAQTQWPSKAVTLVVPFAPGGGTDIGSRIVAQKLSQLWGQSVLVDNRGGAGGNLGLEIVSRAKPDGYTLLTGNVGTQSINPTLYKKLNYNPDTSFAPIGLFAELPFV